MNILCSVYDQKAKFFCAPFTSNTEETAIRDFARAVTDSRSMVDKFPMDYELHVIGQFNESNGVIEGYINPKLIARGSDYLLQEENK